MKPTDYDKELRGMRFKQSAFSGVGAFVVDDTIPCRKCKSRNLPESTFCWKCGRVLR